MSREERPPGPMQGRRSAIWHNPRVRPRVAVIIVVFIIGVSTAGALVSPSFGISFWHALVWNARGDQSVLPSEQPQQQLPDAPQPQNNAPPPNPSSGPAGPQPDRPAQPAGPPSADVPSSPRTPPGPPPPNRATTLPPGGAPDGPGSPRNQLFTLTKNVNFVLVPVTVKNSDGQLIEGLLQKDFAVYEDSAPQNITFFTSDPFPLSAAVVLDVGIPDITWRKVRDTLPALVGAFSQFDEVALFTYANTVKQVQGFTGINAERLTASLRTLKNETGATGGVPVQGGPLSGGPSPNINGQPVQPGVPQIPTYETESRVLNDAILAAANELNKREPTRRKIIFVVSDGRELGSINGYNEVLKVLLSRQVTVYAIGIGGGGIPGYRKLQKIRIPGQGYGNILPKYASATGGQVFAELTQSSIEQAYSRVTADARNQYTIGYTTAVRPSSNYRSIEVRVKHPNLRIYAKDGYYPLPPGK